MRMYLTAGLLAAFLSSSCSQPSETIVTRDDPSAQIADAKLLYDHGLIEDAKRTLFVIQHNPSAKPEQRAEALYWLATIAVNEGRYQVAAEDFERLVNDYKATERGRSASELLGQLRQVVTEVSSKDISSPLAESFMRNGDAWADEIAKFNIDSSWLPREDMAIEWYARIVRQFPKSDVAQEAYSKKIRALLGWEDRGVYRTTKFGARREPSKYMPLAVAAFQEMSKEYPESGYLQSLRYQIAQGYWVNRQWDSAREWLTSILNAKKSDDEFYVQLAQRRLAKLEY